MNFIHKKVRLNASITRTMRFFLIEGEVKKWWCEATIENKVNGKFLLNLEFNDKKWVSDTVILQKDFERLLKFDMITPGAQSSTVEINFMPCTTETEYCTEIHLIHRGVPESEVDFMSEFWEVKLDVLRQHFNKDWVIEDRDLVLSILTGGL